MPDVTAHVVRAAKELAWQGAIQFALKTYQDRIQERAAGALTWPETYPASPFLKYFAQFAQAKPEDNPGHFRNKTAVVYAVTVVEEFLGRVYEAVEPSPQTDWDRWGFGKLLTEVTRKLPSVAQADATRRMEFLNRIRVRIVHHAGEIDQPTKDYLWVRRDPRIWPDEQSFNADFVVGQQVCLDVVKVILSGLVDTIKFMYVVGEAVKSLSP